MSHIYTYALLLALLGGSGFYIKNLLEDAAEKEIEIKTLTATLVKVRDETLKINQNLLTLQTSNQVLERDKARNAEKALKDIGRVQNIAKRKAKLYEKLVNRDYRNTQKQWEKLAK